MSFSQSRNIALLRLGFVFLISLSFFTSAPAADDVVLPRQGDTAVVIPSSGMWYTEEDFKRASAIARQKELISSYPRTALVQCAKSAAARAGQVMVIETAPLRSSSLMSQAAVQHVGVHAVLQDYRCD